MRQNVSLILIYVASALLAIGGLGDQFIFGYLDVHLHFLGSPDPSPLLDRAEDLFVLMIHVIGGGLMAAGTACLLITHFALRASYSWAKPSILVIAVLSEGWNLFGMYSAGSYWVYPAMVLTLMIVGLIGYKVEPGKAI